MGSIVDFHLENCRKADLHIHSKYSGFVKYSLAKFPESIAQPDMVVKAAMRKGLDILCIIDHNDWYTKEIDIRLGKYDN